MVCEKPGATASLTLATIPHRFFLTLTHIPTLHTPLFPHHIIHNHSSPRPTLLYNIRSPARILFLHLLINLSTTIHHTPSPPYQSYPPQPNPLNIHPLSLSHIFTILPQHLVPRTPTPEIINFQIPAIICNHFLSTRTSSSPKAALPYRQSE